MAFFLGLGGAATLRAVVSEDTLPVAAEWVSAGPDGKAGTAVLRRTFQADAGLVKAVLLAAADQQAEIFINGTNAGVASGFLKAVTLDVSRFIHPGANLLAIRVTNASGPAVVRAMLELVPSDGIQRWVVTDGTWKAAAREEPDWNTPRFADAVWNRAFAFGPAGFQRWGNRFAATVSTDAYNSWMLARGTDQATDPRTFSIRPGFEVELLRTAASDEDSWIALAFDPQGRITVAKEKVGLLRFTLAGDHVGKVELIEDTLKECRGLLYAYDSLYVNANNSKGLYRLRDPDGDGKFDEQKLLLATEGGVGHARNQLRLGPDGLIYMAHGDDVILPKTLSADSPVQQAANDALLPTQDPRQPPRVSRFMQLGHILQTDRDGSFFRLFATGLRNPMDVAFDANGEMFTYEADMERDIGAPWYRPNRILHLVPGGDYGWRRGTGNIPPWSSDTLPATLDIGVGSPTGISFGTDSQFPEPYRHGLFIGDWAYGRILVVFLDPKGASYQGKWEDFLSGRPLNVTDLAFGPDGALYFVTGGRGTRSGLYRVAWKGEPIAASSATKADAAADAARALRRSLESWAAGPLPELSAIWPELGNPDPWIRNAARRALERRPLAEWSERSLTETNNTIAVNAMLALTRLANPSAQALLYARLQRLPLATMDRADVLTALRVYSAALARYGWPGDEIAAASARQLAAIYPAPDIERNEDLARLLSHLRSPEMLDRTLPLLAAAKSSDERLHYLMCLWAIRDGWDLTRRKAYFSAMRDADLEHGARDYYTTLDSMRRSLTNSMSSAERLALGDLAKSAGRPAAALAPARPAVKEWTLADFDSSLVTAGRSLTNGRAAFESTGCNRCHRVGTDGGIIGPDLTAVAARFGPRDLLDHILNPSKAVDEKFRQVTLTLKDGTSVTGIVDQDADPVVLLPAEPDSPPIQVGRDRIQSRTASDVSPMPSGLLDTLSRDEVLDLIAYLSARR